MPKNSSFQDVNGLFNRFHCELEAIIMDMLGDKVSYNLLNCVFEDLDETQKDFNNQLEELYGKDGEDNG